MRRAIGVITVMLVAGWAVALEARERPIEALPKDVWDLAVAWTEPIQQAARESRRFDPVSGVWFGLLEGSVKAIERTTNFFLPEADAKREQAPSRQEPGKAIFRYTF